MKLTINLLLVACLLSTSCLSVSEAGKFGSFRNQSSSNKSRNSFSNKGFSQQGANSNKLSNFSGHNSFKSVSKQSNVKNTSSSKFNTFNNLKKSTSFSSRNQLNSGASKLNDSSLKINNSRLKVSSIFGKTNTAKVTSNKNSTPITKSSGRIVSNLPRINALPAKGGNIPPVKSILPGDIVEIPDGVFVPPTLPTNPPNYPPTCPPPHCPPGKWSHPICLPPIRLCRPVCPPCVTAVCPTVVVNETVVTEETVTLEEQIAEQPVEEAEVEPMLQLQVGKPASLETEGLGDDPGAVAIEINGVGLPVAVKSWTDKLLQIDVPVVGLNGPTQAKLHLFDANGQPIASIPVELIQATEAEVAAE